MGQIPWRRAWHSTPVFLPGESHGQRSLVGYSPWGCKESDMTEPLNSNSKSFLSQSSPQVWLNTEPNLTVRDQKLCPQLPGKPDTCKGLAIAKMGGFPGGSDCKESTCNVGDLGSIPELGRSPGGGHGNPLQYFCLENPMGRGAWQATVHRAAKGQTQLK